MASVVRLALLSLCPLALIGCGVPSDRYDQLKTANNSLQEQLVSAEDQRDEARASVSTLQGQLMQLRTNYDALQARYEQLNGAFEELAAGNDVMMSRISSVEMGPLPAEVESALRDLAMAHPDMLTFDARQGLLRFASDFTFDLGSARLNADAQRTIAAIATVLNSSAAANLEVRIVGHTDNVPIGKPETRREHPTNRHLSVHRSISVEQAMAAAGVSSSRILVAGYGEHRPIVANNGSRGAAENRRVEVYLSAGTGHAPATTTRATAPEPQK